MRRILAVAVLVGVALTSCVQNEIVPVVKQQDQITFQVATHLDGTRAGDVSQNDETLPTGVVKYPEDNYFGAFAYYRNSGVAAEDHSVFMDNVKIGYFPAEKFWGAVDGEYFWATQGHFDFICYSPYNADKTSAAVPQISDNDIQQTLAYRNFVVNAANPVDLMYSDKAMNQTTNTNNYGFSGVPTLFHHALAKLHITVRAIRNDNASTSPTNVTKWSTTVNSISLDNIYNKGNLTLTTQNNHSAATTVQWANTITAHTYNTWVPDVASTTTKAWNTDQLLTTEARTYGAGSDTAEKVMDYYVLPQHLTAGQQAMTVKYTVVTKTATGQEGTKSYTVTKFFADETLKAWEMCKNITYNIEIDPLGDEIHFAPAVVDWENVNGSVSF